MAGWLARLFGRSPRPPGRWQLIDPRPIRKEAPFTFFVPSDAEKAALQPGDTVKLMFEALEEGEATERMWVTFEGRDADGMFGKLDNQPVGISGLALHDPVRFQDFHIVSVLNPRCTTGEEQAEEDRYFARCRVERAIIEGRARVALAERHDRQDVAQVKFPDTGWRFYSTDTPDMQLDDMNFVAVGVVLNKDASLLDVLHLPVGTVVRRNPENGRLVLPPGAS